MATHRKPEPIDEEIERVLAATPGLPEEIADFERRLAAGEIRPEEFLGSDEVRRRLKLPPQPF